MKLIELIKAELKAQGLSEDLHTNITVKEESEIKKAVEDYLKANPPKDLTFDELINKHGLKDQLSTMIQSETDKRVTQALKTQKEKHDAELESLGKKSNETGTPENPDIASLKKTVAGLVDALEGQKNARLKEDLNNVIIAKVKESGLPESWASRVIVDDATKIEDAVKILVDEHTDIRQKAIADKLDGNFIPGNADKTGDPFESKVDAFAKELEGASGSIKVVEIE